MHAGQLDERLTLRKRQLSQNTQGEQVPFFEPYAVVWGQKLDVRAQEYFAAQTTNAALTTRFRIRYREGVKETDRITSDGRDYDITQVSEIGRREGLEIFAVAVGL